jgi:hypothetical protein
MTLDTPRPVAKGLRITAFLLALASFTSPCQAALFSEDWPEIPQEDRDQTAPSVDPDANAEILLYDVRIKEGIEEVRGHEDVGLYFAYFKRMKAFNAKGVEEILKHKIDLDMRALVPEFAARVIQPDGTIIVLDKKDIQESRTVNRWGVEVRRRSFAMPGLVPGSIVEYKWAEDLRNYYRNGNFYTLADYHFPIKVSRLHFVPRKDEICGFSTHGVGKEMKLGHSGYWETDAHNVPAIPDEPYLPGYLALQPWVAARYTKEKTEVKNESFWLNRSWDIHRNAKKGIEGGDSAVVKKAAELTAGIADPQEKLKKLYDFCIRDLVNLYSPRAGLSDADREDLKSNDDPAKTLKTGKGTGYDVNCLFASLAEAAGFEVDFAQCCDKTRLDWDPNFLNERMIPDWLVIVRNGESWDFFDPGTFYLPFGMLRPANEGTVAVLGNSKKADVAKTPVTPSAKSQLLRMGDFTLDEEGKLSGKAVFKYSGHKARSFKLDYDELTPQERIDEFKEYIRDQVPTAELSDVEILNADDPDKDVEVRFHLEAPGYADATEGRLFLMPAVFQKNSTPTFTNEKRIFDICFPYTWETHDNVRITYPDTFAIEEGNAPKSVIDTPQLSHTVILGASKTRNIVVYKRNFKVAVSGFPVRIYDDIRTVFDSINTEDHHVLTLHRKDAAAETAPTPAAEADAPVNK